ncbi:hypothetical protein [Dyella tabacisoli]|uniref:Uncharacterized protein n=1 Tax=Dyella tabacisoli TaxID=2282381 RepID=A0A369UJP4_9GAMM|nr:hypothetical protein [Dyella tabacisoli]RDD80984.1 hypothetical protein DVJ77_14900 [Dyella tabacisoli]
MSAERFSYRQGRILRFMTAMLVFVAVSFLFVVRPAHAQAYPCSGPGPGEIMVGQSPADNGIAATPLCQRVDQGNAPPATYQAAPIQLPNVYMAVVIHPDIS